MKKCILALSVIGLISTVSISFASAARLGRLLPQPLKFSSKPSLLFQSGKRNFFGGLEEIGESFFASKDKGGALVVHPAFASESATTVVRGKRPSYQKELEQTKKLYNTPLPKTQSLTTEQVFSGRQHRRKLAEETWQAQHGQKIIQMPEIAHSTKMKLAEEAEHFRKFNVPQSVGHSNSTQVAMELDPKFRKYEDPLINAYLTSKGLKAGIALEVFTDLYKRGGSVAEESQKKLREEEQYYINLYGDKHTKKKLVDEFVSVNKELDAADSLYKDHMLKVVDFENMSFEEVRSIMALEKEIVLLKNKQDQLRKEIMEANPNTNSQDIENTLKIAREPGTFNNIKNSILSYGHDYIASPLYTVASYAAKPFSYGNTFIKNYAHLDVYNLGQRLLRMPGATYESVIRILKKLLYKEQNVTVAQ